MKPNQPLAPKKSLGQNFLINPHVAKRILDSCNLEPTDTVAEIGPGKGALTRSLSKRVKRVIAIEKDGQLAGLLQQEFDNTNVHIVHDDILTYPLHTLPKNTKIIGNLPYNISTPIIETIISHRERFNDMFVTVQLEYGQRLTAGPSAKAYGSFSCFVQFYAEVTLLFKIKNSSFQPVPKVQSCFLHLHFPAKPKFKVNNEKLLFSIIRTCFGQRRKNIRNSLSAAFGREQASLLLEKSGIKPELRAENLSLMEFIDLARYAEKIILRGEWRELYCDRLDQSTSQPLNH